MKPALYCACAVLGWLLGTPVSAADRIELEVFTGPAQKEPAMPRYPTRAQRDLREDWVHMHFMVGADGHPYEIAVTDAMGDPAFHRSAMRALEKTLFEPARLNGTPTDAEYSLKYNFEIQGRSGARPRFLTAHRAIREAIAADDRDHATALIDELVARDFYEDSLLHLAKFYYLRKWGEAGEQLRALDRAIAHETTAKYLPEKVFVAALVAHFGLLAQTRDFVRALDTFETLQEFELGEPTATALRADAEQIRALKTNNRAYSVAGAIDASANWYFDLFKDDFAVLDINGEIVEMKLRCDRKYVLWRFDPAIVYHVNGDYGSCHLTLVGDPGTSFQLRQM